MRGRLAPLAVVALLAAGCGKGTSAPGVDLADAATRSLGAGSARFTVVSTTTEESGASETTVQEGVVDFATGDAHFHRRASQGGTGTAQDYEEIVTGGFRYERPPAAVAAQMGSGTKWVRSPSTESGAAIVGAAGTDPIGVFDLLKRGSSSATEAGSAKVRGVDTTEFDFRIDPDKLIARLPEAMKPGARRFFAAAGPVQVSVYLDDGHLIRRLAANFTFGRQKVSQTTELYDYGTPADVQIPPSSDIVDAEDLRTAPTDNSVIACSSLSEQQPPNIPRCPESPSPTQR
jgi:hypothetical protein